MSDEPSQPVDDTHRRALAINLDATSYGVFAEIGRGRRWLAGSFVLAARGNCGQDHLGVRHGGERCGLWEERSVCFARSPGGDAGEGIFADAGADAAGACRQAAIFCFCGHRFGGTMLAPTRRMAGWVFGFSMSRRRRQAMCCCMSTSASVQPAPAAGAGGFRRQPDLHRISRRRNA